MKLIEHNNYLLVEVKPSWTDLKIHGNSLMYRVHGKVEYGASYYSKPLSGIGNQIVALAKDLTRKQKMEIEPKGTAAFNRLLDDNGLKDSTTLIIKKL